MATPFPFVAGAVLTAAQLNSIGEAWVSYTPTLTQGVGVTATVASARWTQVNKIVTVQVGLNITATGTGASLISVTVPIAPIAASYAGGFVGGAVGAGFFYDDSATANYSFTVVTTTSTLFYFMVTTASGSVLLGQNPGMAIANGDKLYFQATYEVA